MSSLRWDARTDHNQAGIIKALETAGCTVQTLRDGEGVPDLLVGRGGRNFLLEVKNGKGSITPQQAIFHRNWNGQVEIVRSAEEAIKAVFDGK